MFIQSQGWARRSAGPTKMCCLGHWTHSLCASPTLPFPVSFQKISRQLQLIFDGLATVFYSTMYITLPIWICKMVKIQAPEKISWKGEKIIRQLRMAIIHSYLCFGKKYCPGEFGLLSHCHLSGVGVSCRSGSGFSTHGFLQYFYARSK